MTSGAGYAEFNGLEQRSFSYIWGEDVGEFLLGN